MIFKPRPVYMADAGAGGASGAGAGGAGAGGGVSADAGAGVAWDKTTGWDGGLADHATLIETKGWKGKPLGEALPAMLKSYGELEKLVGADKVALPGKDAKPEDWDGVYARLGRPEKIDGYRLPARADGTPYSDADKAFQGQLLPVLHKAGLSQRQLDAIVPAWNDMQVAQTKAFDATADKVMAATKTALEAEWKGDYDANMALANRAFKQTFGAALDDVIQLRLSDGSYLGSNPLFIKGFQALGKSMAEGGLLVTADAGANSGAAADAKTQLAEIYAAAGRDPKHAYVDPTHPEHKAMQDKVMRLTQTIANAEAGE